MLIKQIFRFLRNRINPVIAYQMGEVSSKTIYTPIIVYQMGKVGSKTIEASLLRYFEQHKMQVSVYHTHNLNNLSEMEQKFLANKDRPNPQDTVAQLRKDAKLRAIIDANPEQRWNLISLVRDPIAQNVGAFFHNLKEFIPDWKEKYESGNLDIENLQKIFLEKYNHKVTKVWFENQMEPVWDIDVYSVPFDKQKGYAIYKSQKADLLLIRLEDLNKCVSGAFHEFLGFEKFELINTNIGEDKEYSELYQAFKEIPFPKGYVEEMYGTKFFHHFYSQTELERLTERWMRKK
jgi:hypothetical protein